MAKRRGHGEGSIYQRKSDGLWVGSLNLGWEGGKRRRKYVYGKTFEEVRAELARFTQQRDAGLAVPTERLTVEQFLQRWLADVVEARTAPQSAKMYESIVRIHIAPAIGKKQLAKLSAVDVNALLRERERAGASPRMVAKVLTILRMALKQAVQWDLVPRNVATLVSAPAARPYEAAALNDEQVKRFLAAAAGDRLEALFAIAVLVGPRFGELCALRWTDVDRETGALRVRRTLVRAKGEPVFGEPKTAKSKRTIVLPERCRLALREHYKAQLQERLLAGGRWQDHGLVFCSTIGTPLDSRAVWRSLAAILAKAELPRIRFHDLRHTAITGMLARGIAPHVVARIVGHSTITMTLNTYAKVVGSTLEDAAAAIDAGLSPAPETAGKASS